MSQHSGDDKPVTLINVFEIATADLEAFVAQWEKRAALMCTKPGFRSFHLYRALSSDARFQLINVAEWDTGRTCVRRHPMTNSVPVCRHRPHSSTSRLIPRFIAPRSRPPSDIGTSWAASRQSHRGFRAATTICASNHPVVRKSRPGTHLGHGGRGDRLCGAYEAGYCVGSAESTQVGEGEERFGTDHRGEIIFERGEPSRGGCIGDLDDGVEGVIDESEPKSGSTHNRCGGAGHNALSASLTTESRSGKCR
jgi:hypothetical protein